MRIFRKTKATTKIIKINKLNHAEMSKTRYRIEILQANYWEHFKFAKELAGFLDLNHPKRLKIEAEMNKLLSEINS